MKAGIILICISCFSLLLTSFRVYILYECLGFFRFSLFFSLYYAPFKFYMDIHQTKSKFEAFFPVARLIHNLYSEQWSMLTKIRWPHQGAMRKKEEKNYFGLPFSINHTHSIVLLLVTLGRCKPTRLIWLISIWIEQNCRVTFFFHIPFGSFSKMSQTAFCCFVCVCVLILWA